MGKKNFHKDQKAYLKQRRRGAGFTLVEVLFAAGILVFVILSMMRGYIYFVAAGETAGNKVKAIVEAQDKIEEIRNENFDDVYSTYNATSFALTQVNGRGVIGIDNTVPELLEIEVIISWESKDGRIVGEDKNLNGVLNAGEDVNSNGKIDSPLTFRTLLTRK